MDHSRAARALLGFSRGVFVARRALSRGPHESPAPQPEPSSRRNILFITTDQQRYDSLGVTGNPLARTPSVDALARTGILYRRAHVQNVVCMPSRSTMITGQYPLTHGVVANGISLDDRSPNVARTLHDAGYRTALVGKAHFDPHLDPFLRFPENRLASKRSTGPWRGFDHVELATHGPLGGQHYAAWLWDEHREDVAGFGAVLTGSGGGETGAPEVKHNPIARERYHTDWIAERTIAWLRAQTPERPFFCWMSFPDPHHPFDPPEDEVRKRGDFRARPLPPGHPGSRERIRAILEKKPRHWLDWYDGRHRNPEGGPTSFEPARLEPDQLREVEHMIQVENELVDDAVGRVMRFLAEAGLDENTDVFFTSDHGDLQGDFGLLFKGPYHVDGLMHVPLVWRPAPIAGIAPAAIDEPVGLVDLAPTFCAIAGLGAPREMEGAALPIAKGSNRERVITTFDSQFASIGMHLRTIYEDGMICTVYEASTTDRGGRFPFYSSVWLRGSELPRYDGTEGELYDLRNDPHQWENLWNDPSRRALRDDLVADLRAHLPRERTPRLRVSAPT
ncbi:MAG TPA: sulfatase-like hydrolase/transferase [Polyangiaceae bacterium]